MISLSLGRVLVAAALLELALLPAPAWSSAKPGVEPRGTSATCEFLLREERFHEKLFYYLGFPLTWAGQIVHNSRGVLAVLDIIKFRPIRGGLVDERHPWVTGIDPADGRTVWGKNVVFASPRDATLNAAPDDVILDRVGHYLASMVGKSAATPEHPEGMPAFAASGARQRRMPHAINYIHGSVHYNGGWFVFNNFKEGFFYLSDPRFRAEVRRFAREEKREVVLIFRDRNIDRDEYAGFVAFLRTVFPWFSNSNGPSKPKVLWGNPAPYAVVNIITDNWMRDVYALKRAGGADAVARPPLDATGAPGKHGYFSEGPYQGTRLAPRWPERLLVKLTERRLKARGAKGNLFFVDDRELRKPLRVDFTRPWVQRSTAPHEGDARKLPPPT